MSEGKPEPCAGRLLIVDDDTELCELVAEYLRPEGFEVEAVWDGERGVERALSGEHAPVEDIAADADFEAQSCGRRVGVLGCEACTVVGTPELLHSAVENVVGNAIRHAAEGTRVDITLVCEQCGGESRAVVRVRDYGPGVPDDAMQDIFRPFYGVDDDRNRRTGGVGLGLAIAQQAVRLHGGAISAANAPGGGLMVEIGLPATTGSGAPLLPTASVTTRSDVQAR